MAIHSTDEIPMFDELLDRLGGISVDRICMKPPPGKATEEDVLHLYERHKRLFELVDGTLVEKIMGAKESFIAATLIKLLGIWSDRQGNLGMVLGEAGTLRILKRLVRIPDVSFTYWDRLPNRKVPKAPIPDLAPDLAVEVLSRKNTKREMERKLKEYFLSEVRAVWFVNPRERSVRVFTSPDDVTVLGPHDTLDGGDLLPGFAAPVRKLFADLEEETSTPRKPGKRKK
jgi:Uma2 family endonuclease